MMEQDDGGSTPSPAVTFKVDMLTVALLISSVLYAFCLVLAQRKLRLLNQTRPEWGTKKLLLLSVGLVCLVRIMTILGVAAMNVANVRAHYSLQPSQSSFYDKSMTVLFDLPNCMVVSTYVLLTYVWAECFLACRLHTESSVVFQKQGLIGYMVFNSILYAAQMILYVCIFGIQKKLIRTILYAAITGTNFTAVFMVLILYLYLSLHFSGFPFRSFDSRQSLDKLSSVMLLWSLTRIIWGIATLLVYIYKIELLQDSHTPLWSFCVLLLLFFVCEIVPILVLLDSFNVIGIQEQQYNTTNGEPEERSFMDLFASQQQQPLLKQEEPTENEDQQQQRVRWTDRI